MKINIGTILRTSLSPIIWNFLIGIILKISDSGLAELFVLTGAVLLLAFIAPTLHEIYTSRFIRRTQKIISSAGFICLSAIMPFIYLFSFRRNVVDIR